MGNPHRVYLVRKVAAGTRAYEVYHQDGGAIAQCETEHQAVLVARAMNYLLVVEEHLTVGVNPAYATTIFGRGPH